MRPEIILKKQDLRWRLLKRLYEFEQRASRKGVAPVILIRLNDLEDLNECNETEKSIFLHWYRKGYTTGEAEFKVVGYHREDIDFFTKVWLTPKGSEYVEERIVGELEKERSLEKLDPSTLTLQQVGELGKLISKWFSKGELRDLSLHLSLDYENLPSDTKNNMARELVLQANRENKVPKLWAKLHEERPHVDWSQALVK